MRAMLRKTVIQTCKLIFSCIKDPECLPKLNRGNNKNEHMSSVVM